MRAKANIGIGLVAAFAATLGVGIILHLKSHGIIIQPRGMIKIIHWVLGYAMAAAIFGILGFFAMHIIICQKPYGANAGVGALNVAAHPVEPLDFGGKGCCHKDPPYNKVKRYAFIVPAYPGNGNKKHEGQNRGKIKKE